MESKLQELTDKLYREGLSKGKEEGEAILAKAKEEAGEILMQAQAEAQSIVNKARKEAEDLRAKIEGDVKMASSQSIQTTRKDIENLMVGSLAGQRISETMSDPDFLKETIKTVAERFSAEDAVDLDVILPESLKAKLEPFVSAELSKILKGGVSAEFSKRIAGGFKIGPKDGSFLISLTDETFKELIGEYLRPATRKILFGE